MKRFVYTIVLFLFTAGAFAQTKQPLPVGVVPLSQQLWLNPADSTVWTGSFGTYVNLGSFWKVDSLLALKADVEDLEDFYDKTQIDAFLALKADASSLSDYIPLTQKGASNGVATLDINSKLPMSQIPDALVGSVNYQGNYNVTTNTPTLPTSPSSTTKGHYYVVSTGGTRFGETFVSGDWIISNGSAWQKVDNNNAVTSVNGKVGSVTLNADDVGALQAGDDVSDLVNDAGYITAGDVPAAPVTSVNSKTGSVVIDASDIGLGNVNNTSDMNKPVSTATQGALDGKENAFSKGSLVAGTGVTLSGTLTNRLVGSGNVTINAYNSLTASNGLQINTGVISPLYGTSSGTVAQGNDSRINNGQTAYGWGDYRQFGLGTQASSLNSSSEFDVTSRATGFYKSSSAVTTPFSAAGTGIHVKFSEDRAGQLWFPAATTGASLQYRFTYSNGAWTPVRTIWDDNNFTPPTVFTVSTNGLVPSPGSTSGDRKYLDHFGNWTVPPGGGGGGTATDLNIQNRTSTTLQIGSSTGLAATVPTATTSLGGLMSASDKNTLNSAITSEVDPTVASHIKSISTGNISNWQTAFGWGDYRQFGFGTSSPSSVSPSSSWDVVRPNQIIRATSAGDSPFSISGVALTLSYSSTRGAQLYFPVATSGQSLQWRYTSSDNAWQEVRTIWDSYNFTPSDYLTNVNFNWSNLSGKPSTFTPSAHTHHASDINSGVLAISRIPVGTTGSTVASGSHTHNASDITTGVFNINRIPTGIVSTTVALGNDSRINNGQTAYGWGNHANAGYAVNGTGPSQVLNNSQLDARYLQSSDLAGYVPTSRQINGKALSANVTLTNADIGSEPAFTKNTAFNKNFGTAAGTVAQGNDSRIVNAAQRNASNTFSAANTFSQPVAGAQATASNHFVTKAQMDAAAHTILKTDTPFTTSSITLAVGATHTTSVNVPGVVSGGVVVVNLWAPWGDSLPPEHYGLRVQGRVMDNNEVQIAVTNNGTSGFSGTVSMVVAVIY